MAFKIFAGYTKFIKILGNKQTRSLTLKDASNLDGWMDGWMIINDEQNCIMQM